MKNVKSHRNTPGKYWEIDLSSSICPGKSVQVWAGHTNFTQWLRFKLGTALLPWECLMLFSKVVLDNYYPTSVYWWENAPLVVKLFSGWQNCNFKKASCTKSTRLKTESVQVFHPVSKCYVKAPTRLISQKSPLCSTKLFFFGELIAFELQPPTLLFLLLTWEPSLAAVFRPKANKPRKKKKEKPSLVKDDS